MMQPEALAAAVDDQIGVEVVVLDPAAARARTRALRKVQRVIEDCSEPVLFARAKLAMAPDAAVARPAVAEATLDVNGDLIRAHVAAHSLEEAVDLLEDRLRDQVRHRAERRHAVRHGAGRSRRGELRHRRPIADRPARFDLPADDREVVRHKTFALGEQTADEAAFDLELLGHDFHLFRELATGDDAVLQHGSGEDYLLRRLAASPLPPDATVTSVELHPHPAVTLSLDQAIEWLNVSNAPFVFYRDAPAGRGHVLYRRYDGHYGLITPADEPAPAAEPGAARRNLRAELRRLEAVQDTLRAEGLDLAGERDDVAELSANDQHPADLGTETFERERDLSLLADLDQEIAEVRRALARVDRGTYGHCEACGLAISDARLRAVPAARFCLDHQVASETLTRLER